GGTDAASDFGRTTARKRGPSSEAPGVERVRRSCVSACVQHMPPRALRWFRRSSSSRGTARRSASHHAHRTWVAMEGLLAGKIEADRPERKTSRVTDDAFLNIYLGTARLNRRSVALAPSAAR